MQVAYYCLIIFGYSFYCWLNYCISVCSTLQSSFKIKSAMRGGQEQNGLGPRPKLSVKWAPDVQEPQISSVSHTVKNHRWHQSKKKDRKHRHKGKSSHTSGSNKNDKKHHSKRSYNSDSGRSRFICLTICWMCALSVLVVITFSTMLCT